jgi:anti-sigma regulatory factor (Ser/Thr protein kinase)
MDILNNPVTLKNEVFSAAIDHLANNIAILIDHTLEANNTMNTPIDFMQLKYIISLSHNHINYNLSGHLGHFYRGCMQSIMPYCDIFTDVSTGYNTDFAVFANEQLPMLRLLQLHLEGGLSDMSLEDFARYFNTPRIPITYIGDDINFNGYYDLDMVIAELIINSRKAIVSNQSNFDDVVDSITIRVVSDDESFLIFISDTGKFDPDLQTNFEQATETTDTSGNKGYGLPAIRKAIAKLNGDLRYIESIEGVPGTTVILTLPKK